MTNWTKIIDDNYDDLIDALTAAQRTAIECGKIDAVKGQAFQAVNEVLLYEDGHIETIRHTGGCILGDVFAGKAITAGKYTDWTADGFLLDEEGDPESIDVDEILMDCDADIRRDVDYLRSTVAAGE